MIIASRDVILPRDAKLVVVPLSDIHFEAPTHDREKFTDVVEWMAMSAKRHDRVIIGGIQGDTFDMLSGSERRALAAGGFHESTRASIEKLMWENLKSFLTAIDSVKHLIHWVVCGNHSFVFQDANVSGADCGKTIDQVLAERLGVPYLGVFGILVLNLRVPGANGHFPLKMYLHHGSGSASQKHTSLKNMTDTRQDWPACHIYVMGHVHVPAVGLGQWNDVEVNRRTGQWRHVTRDQAFVRAPSFLKGVVEGQVVDARGGNYAEERRLSNQRTGVTTANVRWKFKKYDSGRSHATTQPVGFSIRVQE